MSQRALWSLLVGLAVALVLLIVRHDAGTIAGLAEEDFGSLAYKLALLVVAGSMVLVFFRHRFVQAVTAALLWVVIGLGLVVAYEEMRALVDIAGPAGALEIVLEGRIFDAAEALAKGLVNRVMPDAEVEREAYATAERIAAGAPLVARWHKKFVKRLLDPRPLTAAELEDNYACFGTEDFQTGYRSFLAKTKPQFEGR